MESSEKRQKHEWLIAETRLHNQAAFATLLEEYQPLIRSEVSRVGEGFSPEDAEDFRQVANCAFYSAVLTYDLKQSGVEFGLYAKICINNALVSQRRLLMHRGAEVPFSEDCFLPSGDESDPAASLIAEERERFLYTRIKKVLSPYENRVWNLYMAGFRSGEIAAKLGKSSRSVENAVYRIRTKLRHEFADLG